MAGTLNWGEQFLVNEEGDVTCPIMYDGDYHSVSACTWEKMVHYAAQHGVDRSVWPEYYDERFSIGGLLARNAYLQQELEKLTPEVIDGNLLLREIWNHLQAGRKVFYVH